MDTANSKIASLNDALRKRGHGGRFLLTAGVQALGQRALDEILAKVRAYDAFTKDSDPRGEHSFGVITVKNRRIIWQITYHDRNLANTSPDPANPAVTCRLMKVMTADES